jgi:hypothetical protein
VLRRVPAVSDAGYHVMAGRPRRWFPRYSAVAVWAFFSEGGCTSTSSRWPRRDQRARYCMRKCPVVVQRSHPGARIARQNHHNCWERQAPFFMQ